MREGWMPDRDPDLPEPAVVDRMVDGPITAMVPVSGGLANTNLRVDRAGGDRVLLRLYRRDPGQARKERQLHDRLAGALPVPRFVTGPRQDAATGLTYAVLEWMPGERLELALPALDQDGRAGIGRALGAVLAAVHSVRFPHAGFFDAELRPGPPLPGGAAGLAGFLRRCLLEPPGDARVSPSDAAEIVAFAATQGDRLAAWEEVATLVHGDCNASNILVAGGRVTALLDWEFAFAGSPAFDLANLLRPPTGRCPAFVAGLEDGYRGAGGSLPADWRRLAAIADLYAWADFLARPAPGDRLVADATAAMFATVRAA